MRLHLIAKTGLAFVICAVGCGSVALNPDGGQGGAGSRGNAGSQGNAGSLGTAGSQGTAGTDGGAGTTGGAGAGAGGSTTGSGGSSGGAGMGANGGSGAGGDHGSVTLQLVVPTTTSFCDQTANCGSSPGPHITITTADGKSVPTAGPVCGLFCGATGTCTARPCPPVACAISRGIAYSGETFNWDETSVGTSTCGTGDACTSFPQVPDGNYVAHMCATPGTLSTSDGGAFPNCTATGPVECVDVPFTIPSATPVVGVLGGASPCPATLPADHTSCTTPGLVCDYPGTDPAGACRPRATCELKTPAITWSVTQPVSTCGTHPSPCPAAFASIPQGGACPAGASAFQTTCDYAEGRCGCVTCAGDGGASATMWSCRAWDAGAEAGCPSRAPLAGSACATPDAFCFYGGCAEISIGSDLQCTSGYWQERGISGSCALPLCASKL